MSKYDGQIVKLKPYNRKYDRACVGIHPDMIPYFGTYMTVRTSLYVGPDEIFHAKGNTFTWMVDWIEFDQFPEELFTI